MIVRLHNLSARPPTTTDLEAITELMIVSEIADTGLADTTKEDIQCTWQAANFDLKTDAWAIVTHKGQIVGYADIHHHVGPCIEENEEGFSSSLTVHPDYRGRGIGTLFTWLVEERARQLLSEACLERPARLSNTVSSLNQRAHALLEREGYRLARRFWRLVIEMSEVSSLSLDEWCQQGKLKLDLAVDAENLLGTGQLKKRTGMYVARQYDVYEKELTVCSKNTLVVTSASLV